MSVYEKLVKVQQELKAPKGQHNEYGNYNYRSCEDILEAVKPVLKKAGALIIISDELFNTGSRYYVRATARFIDAEDGTELSNTAYAREQESRKGMDEAQITGSCSSYARKYALNGLLCIDDQKDPDTQKPEDRTETKTEGRTARQQTREPRQELVTKQDIMTLSNEAFRTGTPMSAVCERYQVEDVHSLTKAHFKSAMAVFAKMPTIYQ